MARSYSRVRDNGHKSSRRPRFIFLILAGIVGCFLVARWRPDAREYARIIAEQPLSFGSHPAAVHEEVLSAPRVRPASRGSLLPQYCDAFSSDRVAIAIKTGATEALSKLPSQLISSLRCVREPMFFSDLDQTMGRYRIHDVLAYFPPALMENNPDFDIYRLQHQLVAEGREKEIPSLSSIPIKTKDWRTPHKNAAWGLDKYKFLHMVERAWAMQPDREWYVFLEADTYLSFPNLLRWLATKDHRQKLYFGEAVPMTEHPTQLSFAYGGAGIVLSGAAVREFCVEKAGVSSRFAERVWKWWFGDFVLADALDEELGLQVTNSLPNLNPDSPDMIAFSERNWCEPAITMHHLGARALDAMHRMEKAKNFQEFLFRDAFAAAYYAGLPTDNRTDWNAADFPRFNLVVPPKNIKIPKPYGYIFHLWDPHEKLAACELACTQHTKCFQYTFTQSTITRASDGKVMHESRCYLSSVFRLGEAKGPVSIRNATLEMETSWTSGWANTRIEQFIESHRDCRNFAKQGTADEDDLEVDLTDPSDVTGAGGIPPEEPDPPEAVEAVSDDSNSGEDGSSSSEDAGEGQD